MQKLLGEIISDYFNAIAAQGKIKASLQAEMLARKTEDSARRQMLHGTGDRGDLTQAQTAAAKAGLTLARDTGQRDKALAELVYALGLTPGTNLSLPDLPEPERAEALKALSIWMDRAERNQPAIRAAQAQWAAARAKVSVARSDGLPTLSMVSTFDQNGYPNQGLQTIRNNVTTIGLTLNIPIFDGFLQRYKIEEAQARAETAEAQMQDTQHQILKEVVAAYGDAVTALDALDASKALLESAREGLESARNRYDHGVGSIIELLLAQSALADALQQRLESLAQWNAGRMEFACSARRTRTCSVNRALTPVRTSPLLPDCCPMMQFDLQVSPPLVAIEFEFEHRVYFGR